ncbi:hypothetical protein MTO96_042644 [Rhipicephalus appendiculatus]
MHSQAKDKARTRSKINECSRRVEQQREVKHFYIVPGLLESVRIIISGTTMENMFYSREETPAVLGTSSQACHDSTI